jgi:undecaprenyl-diphosphatase
VAHPVTATLSAARAAPSHRAPSPRSPSSRMSLLHALILGIVEGITEFLPISSTAHMILTSHVLRIAESEFVKSFEIIIQLGAILSVVVLFWRKLLDVEVVKKAIVAFLPTGIVGLTVYKAIKTYLLDNVPVVLAALVVGGIVLILFDRRRPAEEEPIDFSAITYRKAVQIGLFQCLAMIPGVSRSAATIVGGSLIGVPRRTIIEFSFLLAIPTMAAATGYDLLKNYRTLGGYPEALAVGFVVSFVTALLAIKSFLGFIKKRSFAAFGWYRIALAAAYGLIFLR